MRIFLLILAVISAPVLARAQTVERADIVTYGVLTSDVFDKKTRPDGILEFAFDNVKWVKKTDTIPARIGVTFGLDYRIIGAPSGQSVDVRKVTIVPEPGLRPPGYKAQKRVTSEFPVLIGELQTTCWSFDEPYELLPGIWTIQLWVGNQKLIEKKFKIVPGEDGA